MNLYSMLAITGITVIVLVMVWHAVSGAHFNRALRAYGSTTEHGSVLEWVSDQGDREGRRSA
jgi:hypothetical protein